MQKNIEKRPNLAKFAEKSLQLDRLAPTFPPNIPGLFWAFLGLYRPHTYARACLAARGSIVYSIYCEGLMNRYLLRFNRLTSEANWPYIVSTRNEQQTTPKPCFTLSPCSLQSLSAFLLSETLLHRRFVNPPNRNTKHANAMKAKYISNAKIRLVKERTELLCNSVRTPEDIARKVLGPYFEDKPSEHFIALALDTNNNVISYCVLTQGGLAASIVEPRAVFQFLILNNAASGIVAHNHPSGNPEPSREDIRITRQLVEAGKVLNIPIHDHIIMHGTTCNFTSFAERGLMV